MYTNFKVTYLDNGKMVSGNVMARGEDDVDRTFRNKFPNGTLIDFESSHLI